MIFCAAVQRINFFSFNYLVCLPLMLANKVDYSDENSPSVCLFVRLSNAWIVTKRKKDLSKFLYRTKDHLA